MHTNKVDTGFFIGEGDGWGSRLKALGEGNETLHVDVLLSFRF